MFTWIKTAWASMLIRLQRVFPMIDLSPDAVTGSAQGAAIADIVVAQPPVPAMPASAPPTLISLDVKIKDICDKLGIVLPAQWAEVVAMAKVL